MKRIIIAAAVLTAAVIFTGCAQDISSSVQQTEVTAQQNGMITQEQAKEIALRHSGLSASDVVFVSVNLDNDDGMNIYEVEFMHGNEEFDYEINANTGEIWAFDRELEHRPSAAAAEQQTVTVQTKIGIEKATEIAVAHAGIASAEGVTINKLKESTDDGRDVYDIEFLYNGMKYDYEINVYSGEVVNYSTEAAETQPAQSGQQTQQPSQQQTQQQTQQSSTSQPGTSAAASKIGLDAAKQKALSHAGLSESSVTFTEARESRDDGRIVYDVEFYHNRTEYDYEIDAYTGNIIQYSSDTDDDIRQQQPSASQPGSGTSASISIDTAKQTALSHAGLLASSVTFTKAKLDYDDGRAIYEIEFYSGQYEYNYDIDASSGAILESDRDIDD